MQALVVCALAALSAAHASAASSPSLRPAAEAVPTPMPTSEPAAAAATTAGVGDRGAPGGAHDASSTPPTERDTKPADFVPSPQLDARPGAAAVDGWLVSAPLPQPPLDGGRGAATGPQQRGAAATHALYASRLANAVYDTPAPKHQESEFRPMVHHKLRGSVLPEAPGGVTGQRASVVPAEVSDPVEVYLDAVKSQLVHHGDRPSAKGRSKYHSQQYLEESTSKDGHSSVDGNDYTSVQEYLKAVQADFAAVHQQQQQQQADVDFPAVWGESKASGKPVRFEEDVSQTRPLPLEAPRGGGFPYQYEQPAGGIPEVVVPSPIGPKHHGRKKVGVARPSPRSGLVQRVLHALAAFIPLGLFLASIQPSVITVNASAPAPGASRQRSVVGGAAAAEAGVPLAAEDGADCEARLLCEAAARGRLEVADASERALWLAAHQTPDKMAEALGLYEILKAIRTGTCDLVNCRALQDGQFASSI